MALVFGQHRLSSRAASAPFVNRTLVYEEAGARLKLNSDQAHGGKGSQRTAAQTDTEDCAGQHIAQKVHAQHDSRDCNAARQEKHR